MRCTGVLQRWYHRQSIAHEITSRSTSTIHAFVGPSLTATRNARSPSTVPIDPTSRQDASLLHPARRGDGAHQPLAMGGRRGADQPGEVLAQGGEHPGRGREPGVQHVRGRGPAVWRSELRSLFGANGDIFPDGADGARNSNTVLVTSLSLRF